MHQVNCTHCGGGGAAKAGGRAKPREAMLISKRTILPLSLAQSEQRQGRAKLASKVERSCVENRTVNMQ